ncbi:FAD/NAD(P)-binding domain-containing protein [Corynespora cassiicola Philippines]|uniref:FAD/NAD(P)-binding domain-containing protein n=1 Tax=Corynespora cassiicola Philippines TaxID=1448308 RepID=A0A2T2NXZ1_CORCC|nr:FAD/NAD(P)-binding domain-containing protein [Corynespora cassiicola Philippines]
MRRPSARRASGPSDFGTYIKITHLLNDYSTPASTYIQRLMESHQRPILIIGAGIAGLALAQGLRKKGIPFLVFERDISSDSRPQGWALTIHFSLQLLLDFLPVDIASRLHTTQIDPNVKHDKSHSVFLNLESCSPKWSLPPTYGNRMRVARGRLRTLLMEGLEERILWGKKLHSFDIGCNQVTTSFEDGTVYTGELLVGVDGCHSTVRSLMYGPDLSQPKPIPACFLGTQALATPSQMKPLLALDKTLFQGSHPSSPVWMWFSVMDRPDPTATAGGASFWRVQICLSWLSPVGNSDVPKDNEGRVRLMREKSKDFHPTFRDIFLHILGDSHEPIVNVPLEFWWLPQDEKPSTLQDRVFLAGDAAHTMPLYRGEGFNHALMDVHHLIKVVVSLLSEQKGQENHMENYEDEIRSRGRRAALMCRDACLEVHQLDKLGDHSVVRQKAFP